MRNSMILAATVAALFTTSAATAKESGIRNLSEYQILEPEAATPQMQPVAQPQPTAAPVPARAPVQQAVYQPAQAAVPQTCTVRIAPDGDTSFTGSCAAEIRSFHERQQQAVPQRAPQYAAPRARTQLDDDIERAKDLARFARKERQRERTHAALLGAGAMVLGAATNRIAYGRYGGYGYGGSGYYSNYNRGYVRPGTTYVDRSGTPRIQHGW